MTNKKKKKSFFDAATESFLDEDTVETREIQIDEKPEIRRITDSLGRGVDLLKLDEDTVLVDVREPPTSEAEGLKILGILEKTNYKSSKNKWGSSLELSKVCGYVDWEEFDHNISSQVSSRKILAGMGVDEYMDRRFMPYYTVNDNGSVAWPDDGKFYTIHSGKWTGGKVDANVIMRRITGPPDPDKPRIIFI